MKMFFIPDYFMMETHFHKRYNVAVVLAQTS